MPGTGEASGGKGDDLYVQALLERYEQDLRGGYFGEIRATLQKDEELLDRAIEVRRQLYSQLDALDPDDREPLNALINILDGMINGTPNAIGIVIPPGETIAKKTAALDLADWVMDVMSRVRRNRFTK